MNQSFDRSKTLEELEADNWGEPPLETHLVRTCHRLRRKPLSEFDVEDLRIMIGQQIGLPYLMPIALELLEARPLAEGDYYPGDLLSAVLGLPGEVWRRNPDAVRQMRRIATNAVQSLSVLNDESETGIRDSLMEFLRQFEMK